MPKRRSNTISTESNSGTGAIGASGSRGRNEEIRVTYDEEDERYIVDSASNN